MLLQEILQKTADFFKEKKIESARLDAELLIAEVLKCKRIELYIRFEYPLTDAEIQQCREFVRRRAQGEPVAYILGRRDFYDSTFTVRKGVLIPRPETEGLVEEVLKWGKKRELALVDFGSGSGCIGLSILKESKGTLLGIDASEVAVATARENAEQLSLTAEFAQARVQDYSFQKTYDVVVANPPYIAHDDRTIQPSVKAFEPHEALFAEEDGFQQIREWVQVAARVLRPGGFVGFEIGSTQAEKAKKIFSDAGQFVLIRSAQDLGGLDRFIFAEKS